MLVLMIITVKELMRLLSHLRDDCEVCLQCDGTDRISQIRDSAKLVMVKETDDSAKFICVLTD